MSRQNPIVIVDTNIWLDNYLPDRAGSDASHEFVAKARESELSLCYPVHILKDVFFIFQKNMKEAAREEAPLTQADATAIRKLAWACIDDIRSMATAVGADESDIWMACEYQPLIDDLEDNLVIAAAERAKADYLVTNDDQLLRKSIVPALTPADALKVLGITRWGRRQHDR